MKCSVMKRGNVGWRIYGGPWEIMIIFCTYVDKYVVYFYILLLFIVKQESLKMKQLWIVIERTHHNSSVVTTTLYTPQRYEILVHV